MSSSKKILWGLLTPLSLGALGLALGLGIVGNLSQSSLIGGLAEVLGPVGDLWVSALRMTVIPLVLTQLLTAVAGTSGETSIGRIGTRTLALIFALLITTALTTTMVVAPVIELYTVDPDVAMQLRDQTALPTAAIEARDGAPTTLGDWLQGLVPPNVFAAATAGDILPLLVFTALFGLAVTRLPESRRTTLTSVFPALAGAMMGMVYWILWATPVAVFALVLPMTLQSGTDLLGLLGFYVLVVSGWMLLVSGLLYPVTAILGRTGLTTFTRALVPAQMVAVSTRSSLAALPALIEGGRAHLRLPPSATGFVLPLCTSVFKMSTVTAEPVRYLFLAHLFGVPLTLPMTATFLATLVILSFSGVGVPRGGSGFDTLPAYAAAGIPLEGLVLVVAVDTIPDIAKTLINVTGHMSIAAIVSRGHRLGGATTKANLRSR